MPLSAIVLPVFLSVLKVACVAALGYLLARRRLLHDSATADLSELVVRVTVPCLVFTNAAAGIHGLTTGGALALIAAGPAILAVGYLCSAGLSRLCSIRAAQRKAVVAASTFQNSAYLPLAVGTTIAGLTPSVLRLAGLPPQAAAGAVVLAVSVFGVLYSPLFWGICLSWLTEPGVAVPRITLSRLFPAPVIGLLAGYIVGFTPLHLLLTPPGAPLRFLFDAASDVGGVTVPLANLVLGAMLARAGTGEREPLRNYAIVIASRFLVSPALCLWLLALTRSLWIGRPGYLIAAFVIFVESISPPATNLAVMSRRAAAGAEENRSSTAQAIPRILLVCYALALIILPIWLVAFLRFAGAS